MSATLFQPEPSAKAPCTRTTFLICSFTTILPCVKDPLGSVGFDVDRFRTRPHRSYLCAERASHLTVKTYWLLVDMCGGGSLFDDLCCFLRVRHVGHMAGIHFHRLGLGALRHHPLLVRIDRPVCGGHHVPGGLGLPGGF